MVRRFAAPRDAAWRAESTRHARLSPQLHCGQSMSSVPISARLPDSRTTILMHWANFSAQISGVNAEIILRDCADISRRVASSKDDIRPSRPARASMSYGSKRNPLLPSFTKSKPQPQSRETITGRPQAMASLTTSPQGSTVLGSTKQPASA